MWDQKNEVKKMNLIITKLCIKIRKQGKLLKVEKREVYNKKVKNSFMKERGQKRLLSFLIIQF